MSADLPTLPELRRQASAALDGATRENIKVILHKLRDPPNVHGLRLAALVEALAYCRGLLP